MTPWRPINHVTGCSESALDSGEPRTIFYLKKYQVKISVVVTKVLYCLKVVWRAFSAQVEEQRTVFFQLSHSTNCKIIKCKYCTIFII